jgi:2-polyprenyl-6-methoxyphenol hydroxylase-like FAD-dependent oxidoreductase
MSTGADATTALLPVLIVGAGPAGLASAACLKQRGIEPLVLEAAHRWRIRGGIITTGCACTRSNSTRICPAYRSRES